MKIKTTGVYHFAVSSEHRALFLVSCWIPCKAILRVTVGSSGRWDLHLQNLVEHHIVYS